MSDEIIQIDGQTSMFPEDDLPQIEEQKFMTLDEMREHEWYVSWSGGKDSTATIILMREHNIPIKKITYVRMMWDDTTPATLPIMTEFVDRASEVICGWGYDLQIIPSIKTAKEVAMETFKNPRKLFERKGKMVGISNFIRGCCRFSGVKVKTIKKNQPKDEYEMIGYASDEHLRTHRLGGKKQSILVTLGIDEEECFGICQKYDLLSPLYSLGTGRDGCWFCPNAPKRERHRLRTERPDLYAHILWMIGITSEWWTQPYFTSVNGWCKDYVEEHMDDDQLSLFKEESNDTHREKLCESCNGLPD